MRKWLSKLVGRSGDDTSAAEVHLRREVHDLIRLVPEARATGTEETEHLGQTLYRIGLDRLQAGYPAQAAQALSAAVDLGIKQPFMDYNLALAYSRSGQASIAHTHFEAAFNGPHADLSGDGYYVRNMYALDGVTLKTLYKTTGLWARKHVARVPKKDSRLRRSRKETLRVGLLSGRFSRHAVGFLTLSAFEHVDASKISFFLFSNNSPEDDYTVRFKAIASEWCDIGSMTDNDAALLIESHDIDILIDMGGHSAGGRMGVIAKKPAPVQAKWAGGQHGTTGVKALDFFITDAVETPVGDDQYFYETPVRLPNSYACYTPPPDAPAVAAPPQNTRGYVTFGSFNNLAKVSERTIEIWARILISVPNSRLILKHLALAESDVSDRLAAQFSAFGVPLPRLDIRAPTDQVSHLGSYADVDITLDPFPWSGCVTTCESLWMGVPVLALPGVAFCHRHSASFLTTVGLEDWIALNTEDYISKAVSFAEQAEKLIDLRIRLRDQVRASALCDGFGFARDFEELLFNISAPT